MTRNGPTDGSRTTVPLRDRGFTLIELMVVIVILGLMMGVVVPNLFKHERHAVNQTALNQLRNLGGAIEYYVLENRDLPKSLDELTRPSGKTKDAFIKRIPDDPWHGAYEYRILDPKARAYQIVSAGEDRAMGTEDDIVFPDDGEK